MAETVPTGDEAPDPNTAPVGAKLRWVAAYVSDVDRLREALHAASGEDVDLTSDTEVQDDLNGLADWFEARPKLARAATNHLARRREQGGA